MKKNITGIQLGTLSFFLIVISGCGFWGNFKTYFNTYYNANRIFEETEQKIKKERKELFSFEEKKISNSLNKKLDEVVKKTSSILQHNKDSDYVDDALIMTGKSFYYQQNYSRALRKFNELSSLKDSELLLENKLWTGKTHIQLRDFDKALRILDEVINEAKENDNIDVAVEAFKCKIGYLIYDEKYDRALDEINELLKIDISDELRAAVLYETGLLYQKTENYQAAEKAFNQVLDYSPTFDIEFNSKYQLAKIEKKLGDVDKSLELFESLKEQDRFSDSWGLIDLEIGQIYYEKNEIDNAFEKFTEIDTIYAKSEAGGIAGFYRAEILENYYHDYDSALVFYKKTISSRATQELRDKAKKKSGLLNKYIAYHNKLAELNLKLLYLNDESIFIRDSLDYVEKIKQDSIKAENEPNINNRRRVRQQTAAKPKYKKPERPKLSADSLHSLNSKYYFQLANLLFTEFDDADSAFYYYKKSLEEKEENPNQAQTYYAIGNYYLINNNKAKADSMFTLVYEKFEFDPIRNEAAKLIGKPLYDFDKDPVEEEYNEAEELYYQSEFDKAINKLNNIYKENPKSIYASKSLYTMGYILENDLDMPDSAAAVYELLTKRYRNTEYAKSVLLKLTGHRKEKRRLQAIQDSIKKANETVIDTTRSIIQTPVVDSLINKENIQADSLKEINTEEPQQIKIHRK